MAGEAQIHLSVPHMGGEELDFVHDAFRSNWIAPLGPHVNAFEREFCELIGVPYGVALASGTAAIHLALKLLGVRPGDEVIVPTLTFAATVNPILYLGAKPVFIDSEETSWNMNPDRLAEALDVKRGKGSLPRVVQIVHLYGQSADVNSILSLCSEYGIPTVEDAAESLGANYQGKSSGTLGDIGVFSFNGNKVITTSGGGMLVSSNEEFVQYALKLATQAREPVPHYEHREVGYNYRMSNILAAIGRGQLKVLNRNVDARRANFLRYQEELNGLPGLRFMPEANWGRHSRWLTTLTIDPNEFGCDREVLRLGLEARNIEARPVWKPMHRQPVFTQYETFGGEVADRLFDQGLCLPSSSSLNPSDIDRVVETVYDIHKRYKKSGSRTTSSQSPVA